MNDDHDCTSCPLTDRRSFLGAAAMAALALTGLPAIARALESMPPTDVSPLRASGGTRSYAMPLADGVQIDRDAEIIVVRWQNVVYAFALSCPHQNTALRWDAKAAHFKCPKHHSEYQPTGTFIKGRATRGMDRLAIAMKDGQVQIDVDKRFEQDRDPSGWDAAKLTLASEK